MEYLKVGKVEEEQSGEYDKKLRQLFSYDEAQPFTDEANAKKLIEALDSCTILDPVCGSGAFPMGVLQKMVHVLQNSTPEINKNNLKQHDKPLNNNQIDSNKWGNSIFRWGSFIFYRGSSMFRWGSFIFHRGSSMFRWGLPIFHWGSSMFRWGSFIFHWGSSMFSFPEAIFVFQRGYSLFPEGFGSTLKSLFYKLVARMMYL